jgi:hypothetical protein
MTKSKTVVIGLAISFAVVAGFVLWWGKAPIFLLNTWWHGSKITLLGTTISLQFGEYFFPPVELNRALVGRFFSKNGLLELSSAGVNFEQGRLATKKECEIRSCAKRVDRSLVVNGKKVDSIELVYKDQESNDNVKSFHWVEGSQIVVRFSGPPSDYAEFKATIDGVVEQISRSR